MSDLPGVPRPALGPSRRDRAVAWATFLGPGRLAGAAVATVVVVAGSLWLVRSPAPPTEARLPIATTTVAAHAASSTTVDGATSTSIGPSSRPVVHVAGAVVAPGVYELGAGARVDDAIALAGGPLVEADLDGLNLAATVVDGERVYVPVAGEVDPAAVGSGVVTGGPSSATGSPESGPLDLNRATVDELQQLPGIGPATAAAIVDDRDRNGPFVTVDDLDRVSGIGPAKLAAIRDLVIV